MSGPWEAYQTTPVADTPSSGPWQQYEAKLSQPAAMDAIKAGISGAQTGTQKADIGFHNLDDAARLAANSATFGMADRLASMTSAGGMDAQRAQTQAAEQNLGPVGSGMAKAAGSLASGILIPGAAVSTLPRALGTGLALGGGGTALQEYNDTGKVDPTSVALGAGAGLVTGALGHGLSRVFQAPRLEPVPQSHVDTLNQEGIPVTVGQATKAKGYLAREGQAHGTDDLMRQQQTGFSQAAARRVGIQADEGGAVTDDALNHAFEANGQEMDRLANTYGITDPNSLAKGWSAAYRIARDYNAGVGAQAAPIVNRTVQAIATAARTPGGMNGERYQEITSQLAAAARHNDNLQGVALDLRRVIDNMMGDAIAKANPADGNAWQTARTQYRNLLTVQGALGAKTAGTEDRLITPAALRAAAEAKGIANYVRGRNDFQDLADAGVSMLKPIPTRAPITGGEARNLIRNRALAASGGFAIAGPGGLAAAAIPDIAKGVYNMSNLAIRPVASLSPTATVTGGRIGAQLANQLHNPFSRAAENSK